MLVSGPYVSHYPAGKLRLVPKELLKAMESFGGPSTELTLVISVIFPARTSHKDNPESKGGQIDHNYCWEELQSHITENTDMGRARELGQFLHKTHYITLSYFSHNIHHSLK